MQQQSRGERDQGGRGYKALRRIVRALDVHSRRLHRECNLTSPQLLCLHALKQDGMQILSALAAGLHLGVSTTNGVIDRLEARGLVKRSRSLQDQRKVLIAITEEGEELLGTVPELMRDTCAEAFGRFSPEEQSALVGMLERLAGHLEPAGSNQSYHDVIDYPEADYQQHRRHGDPVGLE